ncbi:EF-P 5-aminopentanol modification-associated protein YfmH [Faecalispora anaeroviscerum]|uniref:EF-P 5-aminopentanol modification-associated protein YfmH n=1 Tax=Faecalispora anaeroviscerum TaxID=2991836 RepID=UPI0024BA0732|nr:pitrilysin family protein [Faecalispora anaeroviscerum]
MRMEKITNKRVQDSYYSIKHPSGLRIFVYPKEASNSTYAIFGTRYGSVDTSFRRSDEKDISTVPEGIAHFLEHKLFESEDGDAFARYAKTGASANAYTSFDMTCYLFSCTENVYESLEILLDFVQSPYFTEQTVQKEQGIIGQEIRMYDDDPQWRVMFNLLKALYHHHPVKIDIAGTVESIAEITPDYLYRCYHTFYNLNNMALCVAGNIDPERVLELCDKMLKPSELTQVERIFEEEPLGVVQNRVEQKLSVTIPLFQFGFKEPARRRTVQELAQTDILLELLASDASPLYRRLLDANLINTASFGSEYFEGPGYAAVIFSGESKDPDAVAKEIRSEVERLRKEGIPAEAFERARKAVYGRNVAALNSAEAIANAMISLTFAERELFSYIDALATVQLPDVQKRLEEQLLSENSALSVISPIK